MMSTLAMGTSHVSGGLPSSKTGYGLNTKWYGRQESEKFEPGIAPPKGMVGTKLENRH